MKHNAKQLLWITIYLASSSACFPNLTPYHRDLVTGGAFGCALDSRIDGVVCWGDDTSGQTTVPALWRPTAIAAGPDFACVLDSGTTVCWGKAPDTTGLDSDLASTITAGAAHVCVLGGNGVSCAGDNSALQLDVPPLSAPTEISAAGNQTCAVDGNHVVCWGNSASSFSIPVSSPSKLAVGDDFFCVVSAAALVCEGAEPGVVDNVPAVSNPIALASGKAYACVIDDEGVQCWGDPSSTAVLNVRDLTLAWDISAGGDDSESFACVHHLQGIQCWGDNSKNQATYNAYPLPDGYAYHVLMREDIVIDAAPEEVWSALTDLDNYHLWNPLSVAVDSTLQVGDPAVLTIEFGETPTLEAELLIRVSIPNYKLCWGLESLPREFATAERCQWLELVPEAEGGGTRYVSEDHYEGTSTRKLYRLVSDDLEAGFEALASGLKTYVEAL